TALASAGLTPVRSATAASVAPLSHISIAFSIASAVSIWVLLLRGVEVSRNIADSTLAVVTPEALLAPAVSTYPREPNAIAYGSSAGKHIYGSQAPCASHQASLVGNHV